LNQMLSVSIPDTSNKTDENRQTYTVYNITIIQGDQAWHSSLRYSNFRTLHSVAKNQFPHIKFGKLPAKKPWANQMETSFIEKRRLELQKYLQELLQHPCVLASTEIAAALEIGGIIGAPTTESIAVQSGYNSEGGKSVVVPTFEKPVAVAKRDFTPEDPDPSQLPLKQGDRVLIIDMEDDDQSGWWYGSREIDGKLGYFPGDFVVLESSKPEPREKKSHSEANFKPRSNSKAQSYSPSKESKFPEAEFKPPRPARSTPSSEAKERFKTTRAKFLTQSPESRSPEIEQAATAPVPRVVQSERLPSVTKVAIGPVMNQEMLDVSRLKNTGLRKTGEDKVVRIIKENEPQQLQDDLGDLTPKRKAPPIPPKRPTTAAKPAPVPGMSISGPAQPYFASNDVFTSNAVDKRTKIAMEIFTTEKTYVEQLGWLVNEYMVAFKKLKDESSLVTDIVIKQIFSNVEVIQNLNSNLLDQIQERVTDWNNETSLIGDLFVQWAPYLKMYKEYGSNFDVSTTTATRMCEQRQINAVLEDVKGRCQQLTLEALLITPVQRLPRYSLLLKDLLSQTSEEHPDYNNLLSAIDKVKEISDQLNTAVKEAEQSRKFTSMAQQGAGFQALLKPSRRLVLEDAVTLIEKSGRTRNNWQLYLFNDIIVPSKISRGKAEPVLVVSLNLTWIDPAPSIPESLKEKEELIFEVITPEQSFLFCCASIKQKNDWMAHITEGITDNLEDASVAGEELLVRVGDYFYTKGYGTYSGNWVNGKRQGLGTFNYFSGCVYSGEWERDMRHGNGEMTFVTGETYTGHWFDDLFDGNGTLIYSRGEDGSVNSYSGTWKNGKKNGQGIFHFSNGDVFDGRWADEHVNGVGKITYANGSSYEGQFQNDKRHGIGLFTDVDGSTYTGHWEEGLKQGSGTLKKSDGSSYDGNWQANLRHGTGENVDSCGNKYSGEWVNGLKEGKGTMTYSNGDVYEGTWREDKRWGVGTYTGKGFSYEGEWQNGQKNGKGILTVLDEKLETSWVNDRPHQSGVFIKSDGSRLEGKWNHGVMEGKAVFTPSNAKAFVGNFKEREHEIIREDKIFHVVPPPPLFNLF